MKNLHVNALPLLPLAGMLYLLIPLVVFIIGWLQWYFAVPLLAVVAVCFRLAIRDMQPIWRPVVWNVGMRCRVFIAVGIICVYTLLSGVGGLVWQTGDHTYRNEIFRILVENPWPVVRGSSALVYYIGFWLPAALVGKALGLTAGFLFQMVWMALGLMLLFGLLCAWQQRIALWPLLLFLLFSGLDVLGRAYVLLDLSGNLTRLLYGNLFGVDRWNPYAVFPPLSSNFFWSFQQAAPIYVLTLLLLLQRNCRSYAFFAAPCLLSGTLAVVGMVPIALSLAASCPVDDNPIRRSWLHGKGEWTRALRDACSVQNLLGGGCIALLLWLYLKTNRSGGHIQLLAPEIHFVQYYLVSLIVEYGVYVLLISRSQRNNALLTVVFLTLAICPWIQIGYSVDFCMRTSMAALPFLVYLVMDTFACARRSGQRMRIVALSIALAIGALTPVAEIICTIVHTPWGRQYDRVYVKEEQIFTEPNFNGAANGNAFFDVLAKSSAPRK